MRLLDVAEEPVTVAASPDDLLAVADERTEVLPWRGGVIVTRQRRRPISLPPEAALLPSPSGLTGVIRSSRWVRGFVVVLPLLVALLASAAVGAVRDGGTWGYARLGLLTIWAYALVDTWRSHRAARRELREWLARWTTG